MPGSSAAHPTVEAALSSAVIRVHLRSSRGSMPMSAALNPPAAAESRQTRSRRPVADEAPLEIVGQGSKRGLGRPVQAARQLDLSGLGGITLYEPNELVLTCGAGTPLAEIEAALEENNQQLRLRARRSRAALCGCSRRRHHRRRALLQSRGSAPPQGRRGARSFPRLQGGERPRRGLPDRRPRGARTSPATTSAS